MNEEMKAIQKNGTWELTILLKEKQAVGVKWIYKIKKNEKRRGGEIQSSSCCKRIQPTTWC